MTSSEMLSKVRTLLDEASASFWTDGEIYSALTEGQTVVVRYGLGIYKATGKLPELLRALYSVHTQSPFSGSSGALPADYLYPAAVRFAESSTSPAERKGCIIRDQNLMKYKLRDNVYLSSSAGAVYCSFTAASVEFEIAASNGSYDLDYIKNPSVIDAVTEPSLGEITHDVIAQYAYSQLLKKDARTGESSEEYNKFLKLLEGIGV